MNMFKKNGGFTLVELIVVIAILAILAGVAVPAYTGYINKANDAAVVNQLSAVHTAVMAANATNTVEIKEINVTADGVITVVWNGTVAAADQTAFYKDCAAMLGNDSVYQAAATGVSEGVKWADLATVIAKSNTYKTNGVQWTTTGWAAK